MVRYIAVSNELDGLSFALYRDVGVNTCYVNETVTQSTVKPLQVTVISRFLTSSLSRLNI